MKKVHSINRRALRSMVSVLLLFAVCIVANAYDFRVDGIYYNVLSSEEQTCEVTGISTSNSNYSAYQGSVDIPNTVGYGNATYTVISIGDHAFQSCTALTQVTIGNSVTSIGSNAFAGCTGLTEVTIGNSVTDIGSYAFSGCTGLTEVTIGNSVTRIGEGVFYDCSGLTSITIPESVTSIGKNAFGYCGGLTSITIPNSVISIGDYAFQYCTALTQVTFGNSVTSIGSNAFMYCRGLTSIYSLNPEPPKCDSNVFYNVPKETCVVYVPYGAIGAYAVADGWKSFYNIVEMEVDAVADILAKGNAEAVGYYTTEGKQISTPHRGVNIVRYSDGTARKVLVK